MTTAAAVARLSEPGDPTFAELLAARPALSMHVMDGLLLEDVPLNAVADAVGTPAWVLSAGTIRSRLAALRRALDDAGLPARVHYAVKANDHLAVLRLVSQGGAGADVVSAGELRRARLAGIAPERIVFSGVGKTEADLRLALDEGVGQVNIESAEELTTLSGLAAAAGRTVPVALRVNPDVDAGIAQAQRVGVALRAVADDGNLAPLDDREVGIVVIENVHGHC